MGPEAVAAWVAAIAAGLACALTGIGLVHTRKAAQAAVEQTELQRETARAARRPQVWADVRPHPEHRAMVALFIGNSGPTVAHNVTVRVSPRIIPGAQPFRCDEAQDDAASGIAALPPGRVMEWFLGYGHELLSAQGQADEFTLTIRGEADDATALFDEFEVRFDDVRFTNAVPGNLEQIANSLKDLVAGTTGRHAGAPIRRLLERIADKYADD